MAVANINVSGAGGHFPLHGDNDRPPTHAYTLHMAHLLGMAFSQKGRAGR